MTEHREMSGDEIAEHIIRTRLEMLSGLRNFLLITLIASVGFAWYQSNPYLIIASPIMSFFEGIRRSKLWIKQTQQDLKISEESIMQIWNFYQRNK